MGESSVLWVKDGKSTWIYLHNLWDITSYVCNSKNTPPKKRWNDWCAFQFDKGNSHRPEFYRRVPSTWKYLFWTFWRFRGFCLANIMSQSNISNQPVCCMKQNSRFLANNPPPKRFVLPKIYHHWRNITQKSQASANECAWYEVSPPWFFHSK